MITEDYVSFETAKLLKEKGFDEEIETIITPDGRIYYVDENSVSRVIHTKIKNSNINIYSEDCSCPTLQMAIKWLRKIKECPIEILWHWDSDNQCEKWYFRHHLELREQPQIEYFDEPEQAAEAAIKYCLENLI